MRSTLLADQPSAGSAFDRTAESTSVTQSGSGAFKRYSSRLKAGANHGSMTDEKSDKSGRGITAIPFPEKIKYMMPVPATAAATGSGAILVRFTLLPYSWYFV